MNTAADAIRTKPITLIAEDGYRIGATRFEAQGRLRGHLIVSGATGVPQGFYRHFAAYASQLGFATLTLDYRGIGKSKPPNLNGFEMDLLDWATLDLAAAVTEMASDSVPLFMVGHSFGGHAFGLLPNHHRVERFYTFATGAGWHGYMPFLESLRVRLMWNIILPILTQWKGYCPWSILRMGEDLPLPVYRQWRYWCRYPHYFFDDPAMSHVKKRFAEVRTPITAANALDDVWALPQSRDAFMQAYRNASMERIDLDPTEYPGGIGHMGYFRKKARPIWDKVFQWFIPHEISPALAN